MTPSPSHPTPENAPQADATPAPPIAAVAPPGDASAASAPPGEASTAPASPDPAISAATTEMEVKLAVRSPDPESVVSALAGLRLLPGGFRLEPGPTVRMEDHYLALPKASGGTGVSEEDGWTGAGVLPAGIHATSGAMALRRRWVEIDGSASAPVCVYTLKGADPRGGAGGISARFELERPDDAAGRREILSALAARGIQVGDLQALPTMQSRETVRHLRRVFGPPVERPALHAPQGEGGALAELVLDSVTLEISPGVLDGDPHEGGVRGARGGERGGGTGPVRVRFHEVEIEHTTGYVSGADRTGDDLTTVTEPVALLETLRDALLEAMSTLPLPSGSHLLPWPLSKLETGLRIEELLASAPFPRSGAGSDAASSVAPSTAPGRGREVSPGARPAVLPPSPRTIRELRPDELNDLLRLATLDRNRRPGPA